MRMMLIGMAAAAFAGGLALVQGARASRSRLAPAPAEPRRAGADALNRAALSPTYQARFASLWADSVGVLCRASVASTLPAAQFAPTMRFALRAPQQAPAVAARAAAWVAREALAASAANDADVAARLVTLEQGATPVVRILRAGSFRPRRATMGRMEARAA